MDEVRDDDYQRTIYVGNLPDTITANDLFAFFTTFGEIKSIEIPKDHVTEKYRGFAFIEFDQREDASAAIENYDRTQFMGRNIKVRRSKPVDLKPNYHKPIWHNDRWLTNIEQKKIEDEKYTKEMQEKNKAFGLPIFKNMEKKDDKPITYVEEQD